MTVRCPECDTAYRMPPRSQLGAHPTFRCTRCEHVFAPDEAAEEPALLDDDGVPDEDAEDETDADDDAMAEPADDAPVRPRSVVRFALRALVGVTLAFTLLSIYLFMHRGRVTDVLVQIPVLGPDLAATRLNPSHVQLTDVHGQYVRTHGDALVFVITGRAVNNAPVPVSAVEIAGSVVGSRAQRRVVYAGAAPHQVSELSEREIDLLQVLEPPREWRLLPGEEGDFLLAFIDPPVPLREFAVEVASVRRRRPAVQSD